MGAVRFCFIRPGQIAVIDGPLLLTSLPITSQMCSKGLRSAERDGYGRTFTLLACKSAIAVRAE